MTTAGGVGPAGRQPLRFALDEDRYRHADHSWLAQLDGLTVHAGPPQQRMSTRAIADADWLCVDEHHGAETALRRRLVVEAEPEVVAARPGSGPACEEASAAVTAWLAANRPELGAGAERRREPGMGEQGGVLAGADGLAALARAGVSIQEDLCLMERSPDDGGWRLTAGVLCFPSYWLLGEKLGRRQESIHDPVPHFETDLAGTVSRFFDRLRPGRIVGRRNWGFATHPLLFVPWLGALDEWPDIHPSQLWLRSERQTLRALPTTGAILFTIRVQLAPAPALARYPDVAARLADAVEGWSPEQLAARGSRYGGVDTLVSWLRSITA